MAPAPGFEPGTKWLTATYSTAELCRSMNYHPQCFLIYCCFSKKQIKFAFFLQFYSLFRRLYCCIAPFDRFFTLYCFTPLIRSIIFFIIFSALAECFVTTFILIYLSILLHDCNLYGLTKSFCRLH